MSVGVGAGTGVGVGTGVGDNGATTALGVEKAGPLVPPAFDALCCTRTVWPTSLGLSTYVCSVAPVIAEQPPPELSQRSKQDLDRQIDAL